MLANLKIGTRLGAAFGVVVLALVAAVGTGIYSTVTVNEKAQTVIHQDLVKVVQGETIQVYVRANSARAGEMLAARNKGDVNPLDRTTPAAS